jgi:RHS repeat-associated protein
LWNIRVSYIDEVLVRSATSTKYYYAHNHLYSPVAVMDFTAGTVLERYDYDAYGTTHIMDASYTARTASAVGNPYSFTGRELDTLDGGNLKTMHYRHRSYDPFMGRFLQEDPIGFVQGINLYEYVNARSLISLDPFGLFELDSTCYPCPKYPGGSGRQCEVPKNGVCLSQSFIDMMKQQIQSACDKIGQHITDPTLAKCLKKRCKNATVYCGPGQPVVGGDTRRKIVGRQWGKKITIFPKQFGEDSGTIGNRAYSIGDTAIHEWAHSCGWNHKEGGGIPDPGNPAPDADQEPWDLTPSQEEDK